MANLVVRGTAVRPTSGYGTAANPDLAGTIRVSGSTGGNRNVGGGTGSGAGWGAAAAAVKDDDDDNGVSALHAAAMMNLLSAGHCGYMTLFVTSFPEF